jgi:hypothetical protein
MGTDLLIEKRIGSGKDVDVLIQVERGGRQGPEGRVGI